MNSDSSQNTPQNRAWKIGVFKELVNGLAFNVVMKSGEALAETFVKFDAMRECQRAFLSELCPGKDHVAFLVDQPGGEILNATDFVFPWVGVPTGRRKCDDGFLEFSLREADCRFKIRAAENDPSFDALEQALQATEKGIPSRVAFVTSRSDTIVQFCTKTRVEPECPGYANGTDLLTRRTPAPWSMAEDMFVFINALRCYPPISGPERCDRQHRHSPTCIPFGYLEGGCEARAHMACRLLFENERFIRGSLCKAWVLGEFPITSQYSCNPSFTWNKHIAPAVVVEGREGVAVLDPSLFDHAVDVGEWKDAIGVQGDDTFLLMPIETYNKLDCNPTNGTLWTTDDSLNCTRQLLDHYRKRLHDAICACGCPPYRH